MEFDGMKVLDMHKSPASETIFAGQLRILRSSFDTASSDQSRVHGLQGYELIATDLRTHKTS